MTDIIERLNDGECFVDAVDDAISEIENLRSLLLSALPFVEDMIGIASGARLVKRDIDNYLEKIGQCPHGYFDSDLCPDCCH